MCDRRGKSKLHAAVSGNSLWALLAVGLAVAGCSSKAEKAEKRLEMVERVGSLGEACEAARDVSDAYLEAGDEEKYNIAHVSAAIRCNSAELYGAHAPAQEQRRKQVEAEIRKLEHRADAGMK